MKNIIATFLLIITSALCFGNNLETNIYGIADSGTKINAIADNGDYLWAATDNGLIKMNKKSHKKYILNKGNSNLPSNYITSVCVTANGNVYIGTTKGMVRYDNFAYLNLNMENAPLPDNFITALYTDKNDKVWIGTRKGLVKMCDNFREYNIYDSSNSMLGGNSVISLSGDEQNNVWVGVKNSGLVAINSNNTWMRFNESNSDLTAKNILFVAQQADGNYYIGTHKDGMFIYNGTTFTKLVQQPINYATCRAFKIDNNWVYRFDNVYMECNNSEFSTSQNFVSYLNNNIGNAKLLAKIK